MIQAVPKGYAKKAYKVGNQTVYRINPDYPSWKRFTTTQCHLCGEWFEASKKHICMQQNSYPTVLEQVHESELFSRYTKSGYDEIMSFNDYIDHCKYLGIEIIKDDDD